MEKRSQFSDREIRILTIYTASVAGILLILAVLQVVRRGLQPVAPTANQAEIALLLPLSGPQSSLGQAIVDVAQKAIKNPPEGLDLSKLQITVKAYDTGNNLNKVYGAARRAARNPNTAAIIGPLDADQVLATYQAVRGQDLPILTPGSSAPSLPVGQYPGLYRLPTPDNQQGAALVDFISRSLNLQDIFMIAMTTEPPEYTKSIVETFNLASQGRLHIAGNVIIPQGPLPKDLLQKIVDSKAQAVVFLGDQGTARTIISGLGKAGMKMPFIGTDSLNDPAFAPPVAEGLDVYYTTPILNLPGGEEVTFEKYTQALGELKNSPFAYETLQTTWLVLTALAYIDYPSETARETAWRNLPNARLAGLDALLGFSGSQFTPAIYVYQVDPARGDWSNNKLAFLYGSR